MNIIGISGRKQSGKNTVANILHGIVLKKGNMIQDFNIGGDGELIVLTTNAEDEEGWGEFDVARHDNAFLEYAEHSMWPYVKLYSFADRLKWMCMELFDIPEECIWGTDEQKNQIQDHLRWELMPGHVTDKHGYGPMTAREFMQWFGTDIMRKIYGPLWVNSCIRSIKKERSQLSIIADVRFPNEAKAIEEAGGTLIRLTRTVHEDAHSSETALDDYPFANYIDNQDSSIDSLLVKVNNFYENIG